MQYSEYLSLILIYIVGNNIKQTIAKSLYKFHGCKCSWKAFLTLTSYFLRNFINKNFMFC